MLAILNISLALAIVILLVMSMILYSQTMSMYDTVVKKYKASSANDMLVDNKFESLYGKIYS